MATKLDGLFTPGGRLVQGSMTSKQDKTWDGKPIPPEKQSYFWALAVPKDAAGVAELIGQIWQMAATDYANSPMVMQEINKGFAADKFSWKIEDGDATRYDQRTGQVKPTPEYMKNCYIFKFSTQFEVDACDFNGKQINRADIKIGDYADIMFNTQVNGNLDHTAGIYLNPIAIRLLGYGDAIASGVSASNAFANRAAERPAGASQMPTAGGATPPATGGMPGMGGQPQQPQAAPTQPPAGAPAGMPGMGAGGQQPSQTASPTEGTQPHNQILQGPSGGGMPGVN